MATVFPSLYRAKATRLQGGTLTVLVPQIFGEAEVTITDFTGTPTTGMGWVLFQGGNPEFPVWLGISVGGGAGEDYTSEFAAIDARLDILEASATGPGGAGYTHNQGAVSSSWVVVHNLGFYPNVTVEDSAGTTVEGEIVHNTVNQLTLTFSAAFSGVAYCT